MVRECSCPVRGQCFIKTSGIISFAGSFFPEEESVHFPGRGLREENCLCARLPLTNEPYHPGSAVLLPSQELGSFMKNKLIMHTKLHLQETFRCAWQSSKMIRFTFCSRRLVTPSSRRGVNGNVHPGSPRALPAALCGHGHGHGHGHGGLRGLGSRPCGTPFRPAAGGTGSLRRLDWHIPEGSQRLQ